MSTAKLTDLTRWLPLTLSLAAIFYLNRTQIHFEPAHQDPRFEAQLRRLHATAGLYRDLADLAQVKVNCLMELVERADDRRRWFD